jgi:membrane protein implicated in regulation of membrane protease activity
MPYETKKTPRSKLIELLLTLLFFGALALVANGIVWLTGWHLLYVLLAVYAVGVLLLRGWKSRRARHEQAEVQTA